ncbi:hypothetical protein MNB_SUP05-5-709 [hydrothermal vent metagenome]|uniref:TauD/TfdA-like domain-containing protein n=1 Tax=hydrothermal vent metagenome TaxID=652676 RepID=A0A1W1C927_9ZZZZ
MPLNCQDNYQQWRDDKLRHYQTNLNNCIVEIKNPLALTKNEQTKLKDIVKYNNFAIYQTNIKEENLRTSLVVLNKQLGLVDYDQHLFAKTSGLSYIEKTDNKKQEEFIPYTNKKINWHTDGYYNSPQQRIRAMTLHCVHPADIGGINQWIDYEIVYILLKEQNPEIIKILMNQQAMTIPAFEKREQSQGPIFYFDDKTKQLMMRYTQRKKNVIWLDNSEMLMAKQALDTLLDSKTDYHFEYKMSSGDGFVCNNILHNRDAFQDGKNNKRLMIRGRYFNRLL